VRVAPLIKIALTLVCVGVISALLSPPIYWLIQWAGTQIAGIQILPWLKEFPFHRVFSRVLMVCALIAVGPLLITLKISSFRELGLQKNRRWGVDLLWGLFIALLTVSALTAVYVYFGIYRMENREVESISLLRIAGTAVGVSVLEEVIFRGVLYGLSRRMMGAFTSACWTSIIFAILHFIKSSGNSPQTPDIWSGFREFSQIFSGAPPFPIGLFAFATLFSIGLLLCWSVERTRSLALPIGLHAGWVFAIQTINLFTEYRTVTPIHLPWVGPNVISGVVPVGIFAILAICATFLLCRGYLHGRSYQTTSSKCA
jgi:uncharacterized protein